MIVRHIDNQILSHFNKYKEALILLGARQVGKTTILQRLFPNAKYLSIDSEPIKEALEKYDPIIYQQLLDLGSEFLIIDEAHKLKDPGRAIKIIYDQLPKFKLIITGSSAFNIKNKTSESLAGRKIDYHLFPLTLNEYLVQQGVEKKLSFDIFNKIVTGKMPHQIIKTYDHTAILDNILVYGLYPAMLSYKRDSTYLKNLVDSVIFKDLTELSLLENKSAALSLLKLLAFQISSLVNYADLSTRLGVSSVTVKRYIELFEQSFILFTVKPYSTNLRDEIGKMPKIYFYDLGLRNTLIDNFQPIKSRGDVGQLFENFIITEIYKYNNYGNFGYHLNYWRTKSGSEVDLVLSKSDGTLLAIEIKNKSQRINKAFKIRYPKSRLLVISRDNYWV